MSFRTFKENKSSPLIISPITPSSFNNRLSGETVVSVPYQYNIVLSSGDLLILGSTSIAK